MLSVEFLAACVQKESEQCAQPAAVSNDHFSVIVGAIVSGFIAVIGLVGILVQRQNSTNRKVEAAQFAITNGHPEHLRDDIDRKFRELETKLDRKFERVFGALGYMNGKVDSIEQTQDGGHNATAQKPE